MQGEFDRGLFATVLVALAVLLSLTSVARFPDVFRPHRAVGATHVAAPVELTHAVATALR